MDKIRISEIDKLHIKNFLKYNDGHLDKKHGQYMVFLNVVLFLTAAYFYKSFVVRSILIAGAILILLSLLHFLKKVDLNKKNYFMYHGIYMGMGTIGCMFLSYSLLKRYWSEKNYWILVGITICVVFFCVINMILIIKRLRTNYYQHGMKFSAVGMLGMSSIVISSHYLSQFINGYLYIGMLVAIGANVFAGCCIYCAMKSYCFSLVGEDEIQNQTEKKSLKNYSTYKRNKKNC